MPLVDLPGLLRRVRRTADLSQRQLATALGLSQTSVSAAESGRRDWPVETLARAATLAGLRIGLLDADGSEVTPMGPGSPRDRAGRRLPAHLDTRHGDDAWWHGDERYSRTRPEWTFDVLRAHRDGRRRLLGTPADHDQPDPRDSLAARAEARRRAEWVWREQRRAEHVRALAAGEIAPDPGSDPCTCPPGCDDLLLERTPPPTPTRPGRPPPAHVEECPCRCDVS